MMLFGFGLILGVVVTTLTFYILGQRYMPKNPRAATEQEMANFQCLTCDGKGQMRYLWIVPHYGPGQQDGGVPFRLVIPPDTRELHRVVVRGVSSTVMMADELLSEPCCKQQSVTLD